MTEAKGVELFKGDVNGTNVFQYAGVNPDGTLELSGSDFGRAPKAFFRSSEYEYFLSVRAEQKPKILALLDPSRGKDDAYTEADDQALLDLIKERFGGSQKSFSEFRQWCEDNGVPCEFFNWY
ncbi:MAG TPA: hypothetical protein VNA87_04225 [Actinomycetota bacterium]|nr:hypothetical protein [Actinomycetota bacterium]